MDMERIIAGLREAAKIADGYIPNEQDLAGAPLISNWILAQPGPCLIGKITGHPNPSVQGPVSTTSVVLAIDPDGAWARTVSRYYRLGRPAGAPEN